jgi:hypothetical protein
MNTDAMTVVDQAERAVVSEILYNPVSVREACAHVMGLDFTDTRLGALFNLIVGMVTAGGVEAVTPATVRAESQKRRLEAMRDTRDRSPWRTLPDDAALVELVTARGTASIAADANVIREAAIARELAKFGRRVVQAAETWGADVSTLPSLIAEEAKRIRDGWRSTGMSVRLLEDVLADESLGEYDWLVPGLLERGDRLIVTGGEGLGKSTFLRQVLLCAAAGIQPFTASTYQPVKVMAIDAENSERQWHRKVRATVIAVEKLTGVNPAERVHLACVPRQDITRSRDLGNIHAAIDEYEPDLLMIGPLYKLVPTAINNDTEAAPLITVLDGIRERGITLLMEAHAGKSENAAGERNFAPRGSAALMGWPEFGLGLAPDAEDRRIAHIRRWRGDRDERNWPQRLRRGGVMPWTNDAADPTPSDEPQWSPHAALGSVA